ncbi:MAG TPA: GNAT family protein [Anaerolineales bacterium]|nr:GNAT family protein [Anaerolineales bacterium]
MSDLWKMPVTLTGRHVRVEPMTEAHVPGLAAIGCDDRIWALMLYGLIRSEADMRVWVRDILERQAEGTDLPFVVVHLASGRIAGATRYLEMRPEHKALEIGGTWYGLDFQRTAVNTECKYLLLKYAFETLGCVRVQFKADSRNVRSLRAIERLGATREGVLRNHYIMPDGAHRDSVYYSVLDQEWPTVRQKLESLLER